MRKKVKHAVIVKSQAHFFYFLPLFLDQKKPHEYSTYISNTLTAWIVEA